MSHMTASLEVQFQNFLRFEGEIAAYLEGAPREWKVEPEKYCIRETTLVARLRDAVASFRKYRWAPSTIVPTAFNAWEKTLRVVSNHRGVFIVDANEYKRTLQAEAARNNGVTIGGDSTSITVDFNKLPDSLHLPVATHLAILCHHKCLSGVTLQNCRVPILDLTEHYDIGVVDKPDGSKLMV